MTLSLKTTLGDCAGIAMDAGTGSELLTRSTLKLPFADTRYASLKFLTVQG